MIVEGEHMYAQENGWALILMSNKSSTCALS